MRLFILKLLLGCLLVPFCFMSLHAAPTNIETRFFSGAHQGEKNIVFDTQSGQLWQRASAPPKEWVDALAYCQNLSLAGRSDWRLPSATELATLVDLSQSDPAIDGQAFPFTNSNGYWTSTSYVGSPENAWTVDFSSGAIRPEEKSATHSTRCLARWTPNGDGTVTDRKSELIWEQDPLGVRGTFSEAVKHCRSLEMERGSWRLPLVQELQELSVGPNGGLGECGVQDPICLSETCLGNGGCGPLGFFDGPGQQGCFWEPGVWKGRCRGYWSQSAHAEIEEVNWYVDFANSIVTNYDNHYLHLARCVRDP